MPRARFVTLENALGGPCPCCGCQGHPRLRLLTEKGRTAWDGCVYCLELARRRGQVEATLPLLCREADREERPRYNPGAMQQRK